VDKRIGKEIHFRKKYVSMNLCKIGTLPCPSRSTGLEEDESMKELGGV